MCGFLGYRNNFNSNNTFQKSTFEHGEVLKKMTDTIAHRGPDAERFYTDDHVSLGFRRLAFIDAHGETSPLPSSDNRYILLFNGEIYNYLDLRKELISLGHTFRTEGDAEVLLNGFIAWGEDMLPKLRGMFAFTIWDKNTKTIFMARDFFGIKPLYYYHTDEAFMFGSEMKAFLEHPDFKKEFDETLLPAYLSFSCVPGGEKTFFKNVKKILPGHCARYNLEDNTLNIKRYFTVDFNIDTVKTFDQQVQTIKDTFSKSVAAHMISDPDIKVGAFLSGGVDSAYTVAEVAKHVSPHTYTIDFEDQKFSEADDAAYTANILKVHNQRVVVDEKRYLDEAAKVQYHMDEPLANPSANLLYFLSERTSEDLKAVLSGEGADEMFGGYNVYQEPLALSRYQKTPLFIRKFLAQGFIFLNIPYKKLSKRNIFGLNFIIRGSKSIEERYVGNSNIFTKEEQENIFNQEFLNSKLNIGNQNNFKDYNPQNYTKPIFKKLEDEIGTEKYKTLSDVAKMQYLDIHLWMVHEILQKADKMSMAHSLELRVPFLDIHMWNIGKTLVQEYKVNKKDGGTKLALRKAAKDVLDTLASGRKKRAFPSPLPEWLKTEYYQNTLRKYFENEISQKYFNQKELLILLKDHAEGKRNNSRKLWTIFTFLIWYEEFFVKR